MVRIFPILTALISIAPYFLAAIVYTQATNGNGLGYWEFLGWLIAIRTGYALAEVLASTISWRLYAKRYMVDRYVLFLKSNNFPKRQYSSDGVSSYLARIDGYSEAKIQAAISQIQFLLTTHEDLGIISGARVSSAWEAALDEYSPRSDAPEFSLPKS